MKKHSAFSLIELSIVILIIGILIAGATQGSRLVTRMRVATARTLTQSSPVDGIRNLVLWLETTSTSSFDDQFQDDGQTPNQWYDINPQSVSKFTAIQNTQANKPTFKSNIINGLPVLQFNGTTSSISIAYDPILNPKALTIFSVSQVLAVSSFDAVYSSRDLTFGGYQLYAVNSGGVTQWEAWFCTGSGCNRSVTDAGGVLYINQPMLFTVSHDGTTGKIYRNGSLQNSAAIGMSSNPAQPFGIGSVNGYVAEIIVFDRTLKTEEQKAVEAYLGKKWGIKVS